MTMIETTQERTNEEQAGLLTRDGTAIPLLGVSIKGHLQGRAFELKVAQRYRNTGTEPLEAVYLFPLPDDAAVCGLEVRTGDRVLRGEIEERERAFDRYDEAMSEGEGAVLLDQERPNVYQLSVGNVLPGQEVIVEIRTLHRAALEGKGLRLMIPTTVAPRYAPASLTDTQRQEFERTTPHYALSVPYGMTLDVEAETASPVRAFESPSHHIRGEIDGRKARITLSQGEAAMDRDVVLLLETEEPHRPQALVAHMKGRDHILLELCPEIPPSSESTPRNVCFLVDCSGSMDGDSIDEARRAVQLCLRSLKDGDRFQIYQFGNGFGTLFRQPRTFSQRSLEDAVKRIADMRADLGGTEIMSPLKAIAKAYDGERVDLLVLTDGQVANESDVLRFVGKQKHLRIFSFGIGAGSSDFLVKGLARETRGQAEFIHPGERIEKKVLRQFTRIDTPALDRVSIDWGDLKVEQAPGEIPPIFSKDGLMVAARLKKKAALPEDAVVILSGKTAAGAVAFEAPLVRAGTAGDTIPLFWARERIRDLEAGFGVPVGSRQKRGSDRKRGALVKLSTEYGLLCSETSFISVERRADGEKAEGPAVLRKVPVSIPAGWHGIGSVQHRQAGGEIAMFCSMPPSSHVADQPGSDYSIRPVAKYMPLRGPKMSMADMVEDPGPPWHLELLDLQRADGSWELDDVFIKASGISKSVVSKCMRDLAMLMAPDDVVATALAVAILRLKARDERDSWQMAEDKAMHWLFHMRHLNADEVVDIVRRRL